MDSYYEANMDMIGVSPLFNLYSEKWPFRTFERSKPPSKCIIGGAGLESMVSDGCIISGGTVEALDTYLQALSWKGMPISATRLFDNDVIIEPGVRIRYAIIDTRGEQQPVFRLVMTPKLTEGGAALSPRKAWLLSPGSHHPGCVKITEQYPLCFPNAPFF